MPSQFSPDLPLIASLTDRIKPILAGHSSYVQGAVLADLTAIWVAGHTADCDDPELIAELRRQVLELHVEWIRKLIPPNAAILHGE